VEGTLMPLPFDATMKDLVRSYPQDWLAALGRPGGAQLISPDLSSVTAFADLVFQREDRLYHLEVQSGADADLPRRVLRYNVLLHELYGVPVESIIVLLRRSADNAELAGRVHYEDAGGQSILDFRFEIVRVWQRPMAEFVNGGFGLVPLAVLAELPTAESTERALKIVVEQMTERITRELVQPESGHLLTAAYILSGLRVRPEIVDRVFEGVKDMQESSTYQALLSKGRIEGRIEGERTLLLRQARVRFGEPDPALLAALTGITDVDRLEVLGERIFRVNSWQEWLAMP
jgi:predicted transposase YdaD